MRAIEVGDRYAIYRVRPERGALCLLARMLEDPEVSAVVLLRDGPGVVAVVDRHGQEFVRAALRALRDALQSLAGPGEGGGAAREATEAEPAEGADELVEHLLEEMG